MDHLDDPLTPGYADYGYDAAGRATSRSDSGSGVAWSRQYIAGTALLDTQSVVKDSTTYLSTDLGYDLAGDVTSRSQSVNGTSDSFTYQYEAGGGLIQAVGPDSQGTTKTFTYGYDAGGNRTSVSDGSTTVTTDYSGASLPVSSSDGTVYTTDKLGNLKDIQKPSGTYQYRFTYDSYSRMRTAQKQTDTQISYALDALGRVVVRTKGSASTSFVYRGTSEDYVKTTDGTTTYTYALGQGGPLAQRLAGQTARSFIRDLHGDVVGLYQSSNGTAKGTMTYTPWGEQRTTSGEASSIGYQGDPTDSDTGLVDMLTRYYVPSLGRFNTRDSVFGDPLQPASLNQFVYAQGSPVTLTDPTGMCPASVGCPPPPGASRAVASQWIANERATYQSSWFAGSGYDSYITHVYISVPTFPRLPDYRPELFNRLGRMTHDPIFKEPTFSEDEVSGISSRTRLMGALMSRTLPGHVLEAGAHLTNTTLGICVGGSAEKCQRRVKLDPLAASEN